MIESSYKLSDDCVLTWYEVGQGRPLVLLHGWSMSAAVFSEIAAFLADDFRVLIPDLPGHGKSTTPLHVDLTEIASDLSDWITTVEQQPVTLLGWSLGGMLALEMARQKQPLIDHLVLVGTTPRFTLSDDWSFGLPLTQVRSLSRNLARRFEKTLADFFSLAFEGEEISALRLREIRNFAVRQSSLPDHATALGLLNLLAEQDQREVLSEIIQPALIVHGGLDQISPVSAGRYLAETLPQGQLAEFPGVGHGPFLSQPQDVVARIREFC